MSTRQTSRPDEGFAADAKGPISTPTPEGYRYFFLIICLHSYRHWVVLAKAQSEWENIWPLFVKRAEAKAGKDRCVSFIITDGHRVHSAIKMKTFNNERGIETITTAPHSQWQDPAERGIQTVCAGARTSMIHGGAHKWMWGWAAKHTRAALNCMKPPKEVPGHEGKTRLCISDPSMTEAKQMRTMKPFLCLAMKTVLGPGGSANFTERAQMCVHLGYDTTKKAYALLTIPNLYLTYSIEVRHIPMTFPLRATNYLSNQLDSFMMPSVEDSLFSNIHGPGNIVRRRRIAPNGGHHTEVQSTPAQMRAPVPPTATPGPGYSSTRGYTPSMAGLESAAYSASVNAVRTPGPSDTFTSDQLAERTPKHYNQAVDGPDSAYWVPSLKTDFAMLRAKKCFKNITEVKPHGPAPPAIEQKFKNKYAGENAIALADIAPKDFKTRSVARGDRMTQGVHFNDTAAPVVHTPTLKMLIAWAVQKGLLLFQADQSAAFYGNKMDREGVIVRLPIGFDPDSTELRPRHLPHLYGELAGAVPGIPQGSLLQYKALAPDLEKLGFVPAAADNCLFVHKDQDMATSLHVDDFVLAAPSLEHAERILGPAGLGSKRGITWGPLRRTLGIDFEVVYTPERRMVFMSQRAYALTILERGKMTDCNGARTPAVPGRAYTKADCPTTDAQKAELRRKGLTKEGYHSVAAAVNFLVNITREDMRFILGKITKYCLNPGEEHFRALKHSLRFIKGTLDHGVEFIWRASDPEPADGPLTITSYSDSSYGDDIDTGKSTIGGVNQVNGATVSTYSKLSTRVDSCINHSELDAFAGICAANDTKLTDSASVAFVKAGRTVVWLRGIKAALERRDVLEMPPTPVFVDNNGVLSMLQGVTMKAANKHIYRALAENRERVNIDKSVVAVKIDTKDNLADAMTKQGRSIADSAAQLRRIAGPKSS